MRTKTFLIICVLAIHSKRLKAGDDALPSRSPIYQQEKDSNPFNLSESEFFRLFASLTILERKHPDKSRKEILEKYKKKEENTLKKLSEEGPEFIKSNLKEVSANLVEFEKFFPSPEKADIFKLLSTLKIKNFEADFLEKMKVSNQNLDKGFKVVKKASDFSGLSAEIKRLFEEITNFVSKASAKLLIHLEEDRYKNKKAKEYENLRINTSKLNKSFEQKIIKFEEKIEANKEEINNIPKNRVKTIDYWLDKLNNDPENETKKIDKIIEQEIAKRKERKAREEKNKQAIENKKAEFAPKLPSIPELDELDLDDQLSERRT